MGSNLGEVEDFAAAAENPFPRKGQRLLRYAFHGLAGRTKDIISLAMPLLSAITMSKFSSLCSVSIWDAA